jgi:hypothetical protein
MKTEASMSEPTCRPEVSAASAIRKAARYIDERRVSLMVSVSLIVQTMERPFTATSAASNPTSRMPTEGRSQ